MMATYRSLLLLGAGVVVLLLAAFLPGLALWALALDGTLLAVMALEGWLLWRRGEVRISREVEHKLSIGERNRVLLKVTSFSPFGLRLRLRDDTPPGFEVLDEEMTLSVGPYRQAEVAYQVIPGQRGGYEFGDIHCRLEGLLGLVSLQRTIPAARAVKVYPNLVSLRNLELAARFKDVRLLGIRALRRDGGGNEFEKLREYLPDDDFRDINWKASARHSKPITQVYEMERSQHVIICIDAGRMMAAKVGTLAKLDYAINAALHLAHIALRNDDQVGLCVFSDQILTFLPPRKGQGQMGRFLERLATVEPALCHVDYKQLIRFLLAHLRRRSLVALFTDLLDEDSTRPLIRYSRLLRPRHLPLCITLNDQNILAMAQSRPEVVHDVYKKVVAGELLAERDGLKSGLTRQGVVVIDRAPKELTVAVVNRYIELKRRLAI